MNDATTPHHLVRQVLHDRLRGELVDLAVMRRRDSVVPDPKDRVVGSLPDLLEREPAAAAESA